MDLHRKSQDDTSVGIRDNNDRDFCPRRYILGGSLALGGIHGLNVLHFTATTEQSTGMKTSRLIGSGSRACDALTTKGGNAFPEEQSAGMFSRCITLTH